MEGGKFYIKGALSEDAYDLALKSIMIAHLHIGRGNHDFAEMEVEFMERWLDMTERTEK